ncbi:MAG TPA: hypothetical protein VIK37_01320 [Candidatus Saccharimonadales bacterium]
MDSQQNVNLNYTVPVVTTDGHVILVSDKGEPTVLFFQARQQHEDHLHADVVAAVRMNNLQDLKNLSKAINDTVKKYQSREP